MSNTEQDPKLEELLDYIKLNRGYDFSGYKRASLSRRIRKRIQMLNIESYTDYLDYLEVHPDEFVELFNMIMINVTTFFREPESWEYVTDEIVTRIIAAKQLSNPIRIWSAGCASGEEAYTIAMLLSEAVGMEEYSQRVKIFATDIDSDALNYARHASYSAKEVQSIPEALLKKYFERIDNRYLVLKELRRCVIFGRHNLLQDAPISKIDLLVCRNTLMYFNTETQGKIFHKFHFALNNGGYLFLGKAEMLLSRNHFFTPIDLRRRIFTKLSNGSMREMLISMANSSSSQPTPEITDKIRLYEAAFEIDPVAQIVVNRNHLVILANAQACSLFDLNPQNLTRPLQDLEFSHRMELQSHIDQVLNNNHTLNLKDIEWFTAEREIRNLNVQIMQLLDNTKQVLGAQIIFNDVTHFKQLQNELEQSNQELETAYEELQSTNEELETTNEELQSTVEELETTNEELQSTNEELETMNEELQSTNEELQTINEEVRLRSEDLNRVNSFLESILTSIRAGVIVLNPDYQIVIWNRKAEDLWGLRFDEVFLKNFMNLDIGLPLEPLRQPIRTVMTGESELCEMMLNARNRRGKAIQCQVICTPLIRIEGEIQGIILLIEDFEQVENLPGV
ncbi:MAG: PAS domain-containing protein [Rhizonema sp. NSF051]|nr:PAS domain-containing protein [Rhizonema sp. NSF051]